MRMSSRTGHLPLCSSTLGQGAMAGAGRGWGGVGLKDWGAARAEEVRRVTVSRG